MLHELRDACNSNNIIMHRICSASVLLILIYNLRDQIKSALRDLSGQRWNSSTSSILTVWALKRDEDDCRADAICVVKNELLSPPVRAGLITTNIVQTHLVLGATRLSLHKQKSKIKK